MLSQKGPYTTWKVKPENLTTVVYAATQDTSTDTEKQFTYIWLSAHPRHENYLKIMLCIRQYISLFTCVRNILMFCEFKIAVFIFLRERICSP